MTKKHDKEKAEMQEKLNALQGQVTELEKENNNRIENSDKENTIISLSDEEKNNINEKLKNHMILPLRLITDIENGEEIKYDVNLLNSEKNKYFMVLSTMKEEIPLEFKSINVDGENVTGAVSISVDRINEYYNKIFGCDMNKQELINSNIPYGVQIKDGMLYGSYPTGWGTNPFELQVERILKDNITGVYKLKAGVIMKVIGKDDEYNYVNLEIQYKKDINGNNQLVSLMFVEYIDEEKILEIYTGRLTNTLENVHNDVSGILQKYNKYPNQVRISSIKENSEDFPVGEGNYWVEIDCHELNLLTEKQYQKLTKDKKIFIDDIEYEYKNDNKVDLDLGYGYIVSTNNDMYYSIDKLEDKYCFWHEIGGVSIYVDYIEKVIPVKMSKDTKVSEDETLETYNNQLTDEFLRQNRVTFGESNNEVVILIDRR